MRPTMYLVVTGPVLFLLSVACGPVTQTPTPKETTLYISSAGFEPGHPPEMLAVDTATGNTIKSLPLPTYPGPFLVSPDRRYLYYGTGAGIFEFSARTGTFRLVTSSATWPILAISPDGKMLAAGGKLVTIATGAVVPVGSGFIGAAFSKDSSKLYFAGSPLFTPGQQSGIYDIATSTFIPIVTADTYGAESVSLSPDGKFLALEAFSKIEIHSTCNGALVDAFPISSAYEIPWSGTTLVGRGGRLVWQARFDASSSCPPVVTHVLQQAYIPGVDVFYGNVVVSGSKAYISGADDLGAPFGYGVYDIERNEISVQDTGTGSSYAVLPASDGKTLYVSAFNGVHVIDAATLKERLLIKAPWPPHFIALAE